MRAPAGLLLLVVSGCTTSLTNEAVQLGAQPAEPGFTYYLPKQRFVVIATYELKGCPQTSNNERLQITQTATITEAPVADVSEYHSIALSSLSSAWKTTSLSGTLYENQTLHTFGAAAEDRSGAIIKGMLSTVLSAARIAVGVPAAAPKPELCHPEIYKALDVVRQSKEKFIDPSLDEKARSGWASAVTSARSLLQISETYYFDPSINALEVLSEPSARKLSTWFANPQRIAASAESDKAEYRRILQTHIRIRNSVSQSADLPSDLKGKGILYREPAPVTVEVCAGPCAASTSTVLLRMDSQAAQFGRYATIPLENNAFEKNNLALSFAPNGRLESFTFGNESRLERMSGAISESATSIEAYLAKKNAVEEAEATAAAGAELQALKAETELIKAKAERIEADNKLRELEGAK